MPLCCRIWIPALHTDCGIARNLHKKLQLDVVDWRSSKNDRCRQKVSWVKMRELTGELEVHVWLAPELLNKSEPMEPAATMEVLL